MDLTWCARWAAKVDKGGNKTISNQCFIVLQTHFEKNLVQAEVTLFKLVMSLDNIIFHLKGGQIANRLDRHCIYLIIHHLTLTLVNFTNNIANFNILIYINKIDCKR